MSNKKKKSRSKKLSYRVLHKIHLWVGLTLCVPLVLLGLTGSILVFEHNINDLLAGDKTTLASGQKHKIDEILYVATKEAPKNSTISTLRMPDENGKPVFISFSQKAEDGKRPKRISVLVDPVSLQIIQAQKAPLNGMFRFIFDIHANLLVKDYGGRSIIGWLGIIMLILSCSGVYLWWPKKGKWKKALTIKKGAKSLRLNRDLHKTTGIWGLLIFITVSFSGVYLAFPKQTGYIVLSIFSGDDIKSKMRAAKVQPIEREKQDDISQILEMAQNAVPDGKLSTISFPRSPKSPYNINYIAPGYNAGEPTITVQIDPWESRVINIFDPRKYTAGETINMWQRAIHGGHGLNSFWKVIFFFSGFMPLLFAITGVSMWLIKRRKEAI